MVHAGGKYFAVIVECFALAQKPHNINGKGEWVTVGRVGRVGRG